MPDQKLFQDIEEGTVFQWHGGTWKKASMNHAEFQGKYLEYVPGNDAVTLGEPDEPQQAEDDGSFVKKSSDHAENRSGYKIHVVPKETVMLKADSPGSSVTFEDLKIGDSFWLEPENVESEPRHKKSAKSDRSGAESTQKPNA